MYQKQYSFVNLNQIISKGTDIYGHDIRFCCNLRQIQHRFKKFEKSQFGIKIFLTTKLHQIGKQTKIVRKEAKSFFKFFHYWTC